VHLDLDKRQECGRRGQKVPQVSLPSLILCPGAAKSRFSNREPAIRLVFVKNIGAAFADRCDGSGRVRHQPVRTGSWAGSRARGGGSRSWGLSGPLAVE
jgi:hypothetical protein